MEKEINEYFKQLVSDGVFPGACYCFFYNGKIIKGCVGNRALKPKIEINTIDTIYDLASLTKLIVTNVLIEKMLNEHLLSVYDYVQMYLKEFPFNNVKIIHLLTHTSGLNALYDKNNLHSKEELITNLKLDSMPGYDINYRDTNYILLGFIIENIYHDTLDNLSRKYIFRPLKMTNTSYLPTFKSLIAPTEGCLRGIVHDEKARFLNGVAGHAGLFGTIDDLTNFTTCILNNGKVNGKQVIETSIINNWFIPRVMGFNQNKRSFGWLIGSSVSDTKDIASNQSIYHTGFTGNIMFIDRKQKYAMLLLSNRIHPNRQNDLLVKRRKDIIKTCYNIIKRGE